MKIAIVGLGTVGSGVAQILTTHKARTAARTGTNIDIVHAVVRDLKKPRDCDLPSSIVADDLAVLNDPAIDTVVELIGGTTIARDVVLTALKNGKNVVTANKALLCVHGDEVFRTARELGRTVCFEAAVAGGVPIIEAVGQSLASNQVTSLEGILNGTCNFILTEMFLKEKTYNDAVRLAQEKGYAEADPTMDVAGTDAAQKLTVLVRLAFGLRISTDDFLVKGIDSLTLTDLQQAAHLGYRVKLLCTAKLHGDQLELHCQPTFIRREQPLADVDDAYNMIELHGDAVGKTWFSGMGAGQMPTASAVVADIISLAVGRAQLTFPRLTLLEESTGITILPKEEIQRRFYLRFSALDKPGTLSRIANVLGEHKISISSLIQHDETLGPPTPSTDDESYVPMVIITHLATEGQMLAADKDLAKLKCLAPPHVRLPIRD
jgi:homoserine dehydrogenase